MSLQDDLQGQQPGAGEGLAEPAVQPAHDAKDFADEVELIEDGDPAAAVAAAAARQQQLGMVSAALRMGAEAEEEDYDDDGEEAPASAAQLSPAAHAVPGPPAASLPAATPAAPSQPQPAAPRVLVPATAGTAALAAFRQHVRLPVLGRSSDGETVLRFSELYGPQGVMAGHVSTADDLLPPPMLRRARRTPAQQAVGARAHEEASDEQSLFLAEDLEVPAGATMFHAGIKHEWGLFGFARVLLVPVPCTATKHCCAALPCRGAGRRGWRGGHGGGWPRCA